MITGFLFCGFIVHISEGGGDWRSGIVWIRCQRLFVLSWILLVAGDRGAAVWVEWAWCHVHVCSLMRWILQLLARLFVAYVIQLMYGVIFDPIGGRGRFVSL